MFGFPSDLFGMGGGNNRRTNSNALIPQQQSIFGNSLMFPSPFGGMDGLFESFGMNSSPFAMMDRMMRATNASLFLGGANQMTSNVPMQSFTSTTVMSFNGADGRPKVYQESTSHRRGPDGLEETRQAVRDSERGINKVQIGHRIGDRKHVIEREMNVETGQISENVELENLDEEETDDFKREWRERSSRAGLSRHPHTSFNTNHHRHPQLTSHRSYHPSSQPTQQLALEHSSTSNRHQPKSSKHSNNNHHHHHYHHQPPSQRPNIHRSDTIDLTRDSPIIQEVDDDDDDNEQSPVIQINSTKRKASSSNPNDLDINRKHRQNRF